MSVVNDESLCIGFGGAGKVFSYGFGSGVCVKIMKNRHRGAESARYNLGNDPKTEAIITSRMSACEVSGVRSPSCLAFLEGGEYGVILMEELNAVNLQLVLNGDEKMPENFNFEKAMDSLYEYVEKMHSEMDIAHNDLYARNIMIDRESGNPYVIDFGRSIDFRSIFYGEQERFNIEDDDFNKILKIEKALKSFQNI